MSNNIHLGTSGWSYRDWVGPFYEKGTQPRQYLSRYARQFSSVEIDSTFYRVPTRRSVESWFANTPDSFSFSPKFPQIITHKKRLEDCNQELEIFLQRMSLLQHKLGPLVLQFDYKFTPEHFPHLVNFLPQLSREFRYAVEIRNRKWLEFEPFFELLEKHHCALIVHDLYYMPVFFRLTAPFTYIRLLGNRKEVPDDFSRVRIPREKELDEWARRITEVAKEGIEVYAYSNNRYQGHAPATVRSLQEKIDRILNRGKLFF